MSNMLFEWVGHVIVVCHTQAKPSPDEWDDFLSAVTACGIPLEQQRCLVMTQGGAPDALMRRQVESVIRRLGASMVLTAVVTESWTVRQVVTVMSWFNPGKRTFAPSQLDQAFDYLEIDIALRAEVLPVARLLHRRLGLPLPLQLAAGDDRSFRLP